MMTFFQRFAPFLLVILPFFVQGQSMMGLWQVEKVMVGDKVMTPVAKWFRFNSDTTYQSGNGWLQNDQGSWQYDKTKSTFSATSALGIRDEFGDFKVSFSDGKMSWEREEEGMPVKVSLIRSDTLPMSTADYLVGLWELQESSKGEAQHKIFVRWDRVYSHIAPDGKRENGYWHIHGHRPEITLMPHQEDNPTEKWMVEEVNTKRFLKRISPLVNPLNIKISLGQAL